MEWKKYDLYFIRNRLFDIFSASMHRQTHTTKNTVIKKNDIIFILYKYMQNIFIHQSKRTN